ncbi:iron-sulfur cluster assembly accessory protein [Leptothermofonsia sichuanensis E412]|uniref:iron-sulfur cluster assembly accessory protein n=1 Tax=Leptothermofonsia sichuanensis TaxID=2917832 RepID=UPI001CA68F33|nr:iron-sulfur cluster assembly accessory protein [Leptothermofonsia sichuanensis]QZZ18644.1 iron-sulfur cluster assembly accessory protein [Leptothermofonsia sichuanensis E412]
MTVFLTEIAELRLRTFLQGSAKGENPTQRGVRVSVTDGGCSGYQYALDITSEPKPDDVLQEGRVRVYIDRQSAPLLDGVLINYVEGLTQSGFKFSNPNATESCGCGQSFKAGDCSPAGVPCS